jgi:fatty acid desaturase
MTADAIPSTAEKGSDHAELRRLVTAAGLLDKRPGYYWVRIAGTLLLFALGWVAFIKIGASWWNVITAVFLAVMSTQIGFLGHDVGHQQVFRSKTRSTRFSMVLGNLLLGLSIAWWIDKHNDHHANPNHDDKDPDVGAGFIVWTQEQAEARTSALGRWTARNQWWLFFVIMPLESLSLHVSSVQYVRSGAFKSRQVRVMEGILLLLHFGLYGAAVFTVLTPLQAVVFTIVHQGLWGSYMALAFAPNHKGMPHPKGDEDFLRKQVLTSRNVRGRFAGWVLGGLNYQIEHHLFPAMPSPNLRKAQPLVEAFCRAHGVDYLNVGAVESYGQVVVYLREVGAFAAGRRHLLIRS